VTGQDYVIGLRGDTTELRTRLTEQPWVSAVVARDRGSVEQWQVQVSDAGMAARQLVPMLAAGDHSVLQFHLTDRRLEDAYLQLIGGTDEG